MLRHSLWLLLLLGGRLAAAPIQGFYTVQGDWELACDNTGTCRAAGYANEKDSLEFPVSLLLQRAAGEQAAVSARLQASYHGEPFWPLTAAKLYINGHPAGQITTVPSSSSDGVVKLSEGQTQVLLDALKRHATISLQGPDSMEWRLSSDGAAAILRHMDAFQRRSGTPTALINPGHSRRAVLQPQPLPVIHAVAVPGMPLAQSASNNSPLMPIMRVFNPRTAQYRVLLQKLRRLPQAKSCEFVDLPRQNPKIEAHRLNGGHVLIQADCIQTIYNGTTQLVVVTNQDFSQIESIVGSEINQGYSYDGIVAGGFKGRGIGDCWGGASWIWDGRKFSLAYSDSGQMCRGFTGGAWVIPTFLSLLTGTPAAEEQAEWARARLKEYAD